jgi:tetratricopeptide (TPR) repeat protein
MDLSQLAGDPQTLALIDFDLCVTRAASLLLESKPPPEKLQEAQRLLDLVESQRPAMAPVVRYWRAVAHTHAKQLDAAVVELNHLLDPANYSPADEPRRSILMQAWQLVLLLHPELNRRVGTPQLALPGRRMEAIAAVERRLAATADDADAWALKRILYTGLSEAEYDAVTGGRPAPEFDHGYTQQLGLALINDPARWQRGAEYLRLAARGLPAQAPTLFTQIAQASERAGDAAGSGTAYEMAKRAGKAVGPKNLGEEDRQAYFAAVKLLAEAAQARGDLQAAVENYELYTENERSGLETLRVLADLHERRGDPFAALRVTEQALLYNGKDKDLLERKDRYYYSVMPDDLRPRYEQVKGWFDVAYCTRKARSLLDAKNADLDLIDWSLHLAELARVAQPDALLPKVLVARARLRRGERTEAVTLLEEIQATKPERFASGDEEDAWYVACRLLGELYLYELGKPDLAVPCFNAYRKSPMSGADTMYKLGQAYEQLGDLPRAAKCYEHVTAYEGHPLYYDAQDALQRVQSSSTG